MKNSKFQNKYRVESARLSSWNYGWNGAYFVTICTQNREPFFGEISSKKMHLSEIGKIADTCWQDIPNHFPFVQLGEFIVMPNHVHGIIIIDKPNDGTVETQDFTTENIPKFNPNSETQDFASLPNLKQTPQNEFGPQSKNLASIIRGFKIGVTKNTRKIRSDFKWQSRFHDHIIRNEESFQRISEYIRVNPTNWKKDKFYFK